MKFHPNEFEIQEYLLNELSPSRKRELESHLNFCPECQNHMSLYRELFRDLTDESSMQLSETFTSAVMKMVKSSSTEFDSKSIWNTLAIVFAAIAGFCYTLFYTGTELYLEIWQRLIHQFANLDLSWLSTFTDIVPWNIIFTAGFILLSVKVFDKICLNRFVH